MNRRSLLAMLGLAPVAAPVALAAKQAVHETTLISSAAHIENLMVGGYAGGLSDTVIDGTRISCSSIRADRITCGSLPDEDFIAGAVRAGRIPCGSITPGRLFETRIDPFCTDQDRLIGALSFGA
ncbi:hypothetical protein [Methylobacterium nodulans]|uniref:Uncharacterized protein n=1 Tax=Methylobacterium nodulans (strain LMG 21967 / CNCM I-2342 / ORS 2060) TaxID=460265 RepID=B8IIW3_METNO|nr:hypothetical protein [Methylobacterium nodulans]ACL61758.1 hypothetical protein Mnod_7017 [Methylobacterium nodulans ORS 2060]